MPFLSISSRPLLFPAVLPLSLVLVGCGGDSPTPAPTNTAPQFTSSATVSVAENSAGTIYTAAASDPNGDPVSFSIVGGADSAAFSLAGAGLSFLNAPNFERPGDSDGDNQFEVRLQVSDGRGGAATLDLVVTVTNDREGIRVTRIVTGLADPVGLTPTFANDREMAVALRDGSFVRFPGDRSPNDPLTGFEAALPGGADFVRLLDIAWGEPTAFWTGPAFLFESSFAFQVFRPNQGQRRDGNVTFGTNSQVNGRLFIGGSGEALASLSDPTGSFAQGSQTPNQDRFGRVFRLEPSSGASLLSIGVNQIGGGVRESGGFAEINGQTLLADRGGSDEHEISLFTVDPATQTSNPVNFGWPFFEGTLQLQTGAPTPLIDPVLTYRFGTGEKQGSGIVLGTAYSGSIEGIRDQFVFADSDGSIFTVGTDELDGSAVLTGSDFELRSEDFAPDSGTLDEILEIAEDPSGTLYILDGDGEIFRVDPA